MRRRSVARAVALAVVGGGLWASPSLGQGISTASDQPAGAAPRSVYDRGPRASSAPAEPRRLPAQSRPVERPITPARPRGYLSHGLSEARQAANEGSANSKPVAQSAPANRTAPATRPAPAPMPRATRAIVPTFFPAPIGANDPAKSADAQPPASQQIAMQLNSAAPNEHPLLPAVRWAKLCMQKMDTVRDYSAKMAKRERIDGTLSEYEYMFVKVRHEPFSVYVSFIGPARVKGQEAIFVKGHNDNKLLAHGTGVRKIFGTVSLQPDSMLAMTGNRYPITEMGIKRLTERLVEVGEHDAQFGECEVKAFPNTKINGRDCVCLRVVHPVQRREFLFNMAKIYVDSQHNLPVRYEAYDWPHDAGGEPVLLEEYTYLDLKVNNGFTDRDFDVSNPEYQFR